MSETSRHSNLMDVFVVDVTPPIHEDEARAIIRTIRTSMEATRLLLVRLYTGKAWLTLGYNSFHELLIAEFPEMHHTHLRRLTNAGLLEQRVGVDVGSTPEAHLRPLLQIIPDDDLQVEAYEFAQERAAATTKDYERTALETYVYTYADEPIKVRMYRGELSPRQAYDIQKALEKETSFDVHTIGSLVTDHELIPIFSRLAARQSETWTEIMLSKCIPAYPDPIPLAKATAANLLAWLDEASAEHRAVARLSRQEWYKQRDEALQALVHTAWKVRKGESGLDSLYQKLDTLHEVEQNDPSSTRT
jgi:hypothetical protein